MPPGFDFELGLISTCSTPNVCYLLFIGSAYDSSAPYGPVLNTHRDELMAVPLTSPCLVFVLFSGAQLFIPVTQLYNTTFSPVGDVYSIMLFATDTECKDDHFMALCERSCYSSAYIQSSSQPLATLCTYFMEVTHPGVHYHATYRSKVKACLSCVF